MPYVDPDDANTDVVVRFHGDPFPQPTTHNTFERRESPVGEILGDTSLHSPSYLPETECLMAAPGACPSLSAEAAAEYGDLVDAAYEAALSSLRPKQREAWGLEQDGLTQRDSATRLAIRQQSVLDRLRGARRRLSAQMDWVIAPELKAKYHRPKPPAKPRPIAWTLTMQRIGADLAYIDTDEAARWRVARQLNHALSIGMSPTDLCRRTGMVPTVLAQLVAEFRNG